MLVLWQHPSTGGCMQAPFQRGLCKHHAIYSRRTCFNLLLILHQNSAQANVRKILCITNRLIVNLFVLEALSKQLGFCKRIRHKYVCFIHLKTNKFWNWFRTPPRSLFHLEGIIKRWLLYEDEGNSFNSWQRNF